MKKALLFLMLLLPLGGVLQSCSDDDDEIAAYYERELAQKIKVVNEFKTIYKGKREAAIKQGGEYYPGTVPVDEIEIVDGRYLKARSYVMDLMRLIGYSGPFSLLDTRPYSGDCVLIFE